MRDPVEPIPSPYASTASARTYWERSGPPGWEPMQQSADAQDYDPGRLLAGREDMLGIDRRSHSRRATAPRAQGNRLTAANHRRVDALLGLRSRHGWAMVRSLAMAPAGLLVHLFDLMDPELGEEERRHGRATFARLCADLGAPRGARTAPAPARAQRNPDTPSSPLAAVGGCVLARRVVADLSHWINGRPGQPSSRAAQDLPVTLVVPCRRHGASGATAQGRRSPPRVTLVQIPGTLAPLTDPHPEVLAVALSPAARSRLSLALGLGEG